MIVVSQSGHQGRVDRINTMHKIIKTLRNRFCHLNSVNPVEDFEERDRQWHLRVGGKMGILNVRTAF